MPGTLILKRNRYTRMGGENYRVFCDAADVGTIEHHTGCVDPAVPWFWGITLTLRRPGPDRHQGTCATREEATAAFRKAWDAMGE